MKRITEYDSFKDLNEADISYFDLGKSTVLFFIKNKLIGEIKVWTDYDNDDREYITINYNVVYLDNIKKMKFVPDYSNIDNKDCYNCEYLNKNFPECTGCEHDTYIKWKPINK